VTYSIKFTIQELPKPVNRLNGRHWAAMKKYRDYWHALVAAAVCGKKPPKPLKYANLTLVRFSSVEPDWDGNVSSWKPVIDALRYCGVLEDDKVSNIGTPKCLWEKAKPKHGHIFVSVEEAEGNAAS
jgi:hypothetical protein